MDILPAIYSGCSLCNFFLVKTRGPSLTLVDSVRREFTEADSTILITKVETVADAVSKTGPIVDSRFLASLSFAFAGTALLLAFAGVYGLAAYAAGQRLREMGIRVALGATRWDILRIMMQHCVAPSAAGIVLGLIGASMLTTLLKAYLFEVDPAGKAPLVPVSLLLIGVATLANFFPALRTTRIDPMTALRQE